MPQYGAPMYREPVQAERRLDQANAASRANAAAREARNSQQLRGNRPEVRNPQPQTPQPTKKPEVTAEQRAKYIAEKKKLLDGMTPEEKKAYRAKEAKNMTAERKQAMDLLRNFRKEHGKSAPLPPDLQKQIKSLLSQSLDKEIIARSQMLSKPAPKKAAEAAKGQTVKTTAPKPPARNPEANPQAQPAAKPAKKASTSMATEPAKKPQVKGMGK